MPTQTAASVAKATSRQSRDALETTSGGPLYVARWGATGPPIVLVHGLGGSHLNWLSIAPGLGARAVVDAIDLPGFGRTPSAGREAGLPAYAQVLEEHLSGLPGKAVLVGNSMGGLISMIVAARSPGLVRGLVLIGPAVPRGVRDPVDPRIGLLYSSYLWPGFGELVRSARSRILGPVGSARETLRICCLHPERIAPAVVKANVAMAVELAVDGSADRTYLKAFRSTWSTLINPFFFDRTARSVMAPTLLIHGRQDRLIPTEAVRRLARLRPDWDLRILQDTGHCPQLEAPNKVLDLVNPWLASLPTFRERRLRA